MLLFYDAVMDMTLFLLVSIVNIYVCMHMHLLVCVYKVLYFFCKMAVAS